VAVERQALQDWHRLFGLLLTDFFTDSPFAVEVERDLSEQQQFLDVAIVRHSRGRFAGRLPDGLEDLAAFNLVTFKSHHEALDARAMRELIHHFVAYQKLVSPSPSELLPDEQFRLYAVCARFPHNLAGQVPWQERQAGVYDCQWGTDTVRVIVAGQLPRQAHNAPLHLFSASPELAEFGSRAYRQRSADTSGLLGQLLETLRGEGFTMTYTMEDFRRDYARRNFHRLTPQEQREAVELLSPEQRRELLKSLPPEQQRELVESLPPEQRLAGLPPEQRLAGLPPEQRLAGLTEEQIRRYLEQLTAAHPSPRRKPRRKR
jgi:hypothetical protein